MGFLFGNGIEPLGGGALLEEVTSDEPGGLITQPHFPLSALYLPLLCDQPASWWLLLHHLTMMEQHP